MNESKPGLLREQLVRDIYRRYSTDPAGVDESWGEVFDGLEGAELTGAARESDSRTIDPYRTALILGRVIEAYRWRGHLAADLDPLELENRQHDFELALDRIVLSFGDRSVAPVGDGELALSRGNIAEVLRRLETIYCGRIGFEYMQVERVAVREWLRRAIETRDPVPDLAKRRAAAQHLIEADEFESFMQRRFVGKKRFGAEGAEALVPCLWAALGTAVDLGARYVVMGGTSRGRLNQLANFVGKPCHALFAEVSGAAPFSEPTGKSGDVTYHLGCLGHQTLTGHEIPIEYCNNPSHLEAVNTVALGRARQLQDMQGGADAARSRILPLLIHTDAAFAGQGVVSEMFQLGGLDAFDVGGTIHVVINNQLGFTTNPSQARTSRYCTDVAKAVGAPVFHVNADDVDAVVHVGQLAGEIRQRFGIDVVIDLVCYRRHGHNELDEPSFTQPQMYARIADRPSARRLYLDALSSEGAFSKDEEVAVETAYRQRLEAAFQASKSYKPNAAASFTTTSRTGTNDEVPAVSSARLRDIGLALVSEPRGCKLHPKLARLLVERRKAIETAEDINWALAEALALGTLACDGVAVRLSGQDTPRGAFSQRHFIAYDQHDGRGYSIFDQLPQPSAACQLVASPLAEYATLGFEYGYSLETTGRLVVWEAQFGDFANVAQPVIDQFIVSGEDKWLQQSSLVMLLPHGLDGQGPEHSSGRIERFLQMCARDNVVVVNCSTPANYFHALRRQAYGRPRPLIIFTPKSLLRHRRAVSKLGDMAVGTGFQPIIRPSAADDSVSRLVICSGKIYWELEAERERLELTEVGLLRIEQLYPFPEDTLVHALAEHKDAEIVWCQEEPRNMGAWSFVEQRIRAALDRAECTVRRPTYAGRPEAPSPAIGSSVVHAQEQQQLIRTALGADAGDPAVLRST